MDYIIVPTSKCLYQKWQLKLLQWSANKVKQKGKLIFLVSHDYNHFSETLSFNYPNAEVIDLPDWAKEWEVKKGEWWGGIPNKYESVKWLVENKQFNPSDRLLFLDPDMIFTEPVDLYPKNNEVIGQKWKNFSPLTEYPSNSIDSIMYPFAITFYTLKKIVKDYKEYCIDIRTKTNRWESEMWGLHYALEKNNIKINPIEDLGRCTIWNEDNSLITSKLYHFPNKIESKDKENLFFKQDYTVNLTQKIEINKGRNLTDKILLSNIDQERTDYIYENKWDTTQLFKFYTGNKGYLFFKPWAGGFNNIRMSFEQAICLAYLTNRTLVFPPDYNMYLLKKEKNNFNIFFETTDLGVKQINFKEFCNLKDIEPNLDRLKEISKVTNYDSVANVINFEKIPVPKKFSKGRSIINSEDIFDDFEIIYLDENLLGSFHQAIYSKYETNLKKLVGKYVVYKNDLRDFAWRFINYLGDKSYYSLHVRRNDFQYKDLFIDGQTLYNNIKNIIPEGSKLYIATDADDDSLFNIISQKYQVTFYKDILSHLNPEEYNNDWIALIEQLICSRGIKFIGNENSTLSSYIYRLRCYMNDIQDKSYYLNTVSNSPSSSDLLISEQNYQSNWVREYRDISFFDQSIIFVSIASYLDTQIFDTLKSLYEEVSDCNKVRVVVHLQDIEEQYEKLLNLDYPNLEIIFTPNTQTQGVVWARNRIKDKFINEPYFLQVDSHSRFKENWDLILINQYNSIEEPKVILSTYPNHFDVPDLERNYLNLPYNTPLTIDRFVNLSSDIDNRLKMKNLPSLEDYQVVDTKWVSAGFLFTRGEWVKQVNIPEQMIFSGEEDSQTHLSYLKGWNIKITSEATVWHNYEYKTIEDIPYRTHNNQYHLEDNSIEEINNLLFNQNYTRSLKDLESYLNFKFKTPSKTIFIALASYIDNDLRNTILSCINQSKYPENLSFGILLQYNDKLETNESCIDDLISKYNIRLTKIPYQQSKGNAWARSQVENLYQNEDYVLQIDSHLRLSKHWDEFLINEHSNLKGKSIISYLSPSFFKNEELGIDYNFDNLDNLSLLNIPKITEITNEYWPVFQGYSNIQPTNGLNKMVSILYCGFVFAQGDWIKEIKNDPEHYYTGEEFALSIRSFTHGYDIYQPTKAISWHRSNPNHIHHFKVVDDNDERHTHAVGRLRKLIFNEDLGRYGLGNIRTLQEYENFAKINIKEKRVYT